jgi:hypothetical protein
MLTGKIILRLDGGEKIAKTGEFIVQQGVNHEWINRSESDPCRLLLSWLGVRRFSLGMEPFWGRRLSRGERGRSRWWPWLPVTYIL